MRQTEEEKTQEGKEEAVWRWGRDGRCIYKPGPPGLPATPRARQSAWVDCPSEPPGQPVLPATHFTLLASRAMRQYIYVLWSPWFCANLLLQSLETNTEWCGGRRWGRNHSQTGEHCSGPHARRDCSTPNSGDGNGGDQEESVPQFSRLTSYISPMCITHTKLIYWALIMCQVVYTLHSLFHSHNKNRRWLLLGRKAMTKTWHRVKRQKHHFAYKGPYSQSYGLSSSHVQMRDLGNEAWVPKNWGLQTVGLEKTLASPWDCKEIKPINLKGNQPWIFFGGTGAEAEAPVFWLPDVKSWLTGKDPDAVKAEGKKGHGRWDGWMASPIQWTWTWANSQRWWWTGKPGVLQSMGSQRVGHDLVTEQQQQQ